MKFFPLLTVLSLTAFFGWSSTASTSSSSGGTNETSAAHVTTTSELAEWCRTETCSTEQHKYCEITNSESDFTGTWNASCSCQPGFLPIGSDCVSDDIIIGVSVGVGGAIILGLTIAVICLAVRKPSHSSGKSDHTKSSAENEAQLTNPDELFIKTSSQQSVDNTGTDVVQQSAVAMATNVKVGHTAAAAVVVVATAAADVGGGAGITSTIAEPKPPVHVEQDQRSPPVTNNPQSDNKPVQVSTPDYDLSQPMALNTQFNSSSDMEATINIFVPQLQNVDTFGNYSIKRPATLNQPGPQYQNPTGPYNPDYKYF